MRLGSVIVFFASGIALILLSADAYSQRTSELSADLPDSRTMVTQDKVEALFDDGDFGRAYFIYRNELAPVGDKYAQYMVGYMLEMGLGVEKDVVGASAWYRLAAERETPEFVAVRNQALESMNEDDRRRSDAEYIELREQYCDLAVLLKSVKRNLRDFNSKTGSRIQSDSNSMTVIEASGVRSGTDYYGVLYSQLEDRLKLMREFGGFDDMEVDPERVNLNELERRVREHLASYE